MTFGGKAATRIAVVSSTLLWCLTPVGAALGACNVVVSNLNSAGTVITGETGTLTNGYTYELKKLVVESDLERVEQALVAAFAAQVCPNAMFTVDTDYDSDTLDGLNIPDVTKAPAVALVGPDLVDDQIFGVGVPTATAVLDGAGAVAYYENRVPPVSVALQYQVVVVSKTRGTMLRMLADARAFTRRMPYLEVAKNPSNANAGVAQFLLQTVSEPARLIGPNLANLRAFSMGLLVRGIPLEGTRGDAASLVDERTYPAETITVGAYSTQETA